MKRHRNIVLHFCLSLLCLFVLFAFTTRTSPESEQAKKLIALGSGIKIEKTFATCYDLALCGNGNFPSKGIKAYVFSSDNEKKVWVEYYIDLKESKPKLDSIVKVMSESKNKVLLVEGYVAAGGTALEKKNENASSEVVAKLIKKYLVENKIEGDRIVTQGCGVSRQYADGPHKDSKYFPIEFDKNNRVELFLYAK